MVLLQHYDIWQGLEFVAVLVTIFTFIILIFLSFSLYKCLEKQDQEILKGANPDLRDYLLGIAKKPMLWVVGYNGDEREKIPANKVDESWIDEYKLAIILRLAPIYTMYIGSLLILTRPVHLGNGMYIPFDYSKNVYELYGMLIVYVMTNVLCDLVSIRFTIAHLTKAQHTKRYLFYFAKDGLVASAVFAISQLISCLLWVYKRENPNEPKFEDGIISAMVDITFWPYSFFSPGTVPPQMTSELFPGQLIITGTVFFPTIVLIILFIVFSLFLNVAYTVKKILVYANLDRICRKFLRLNISTMFQPIERMRSFGYCNVAMISILNLCFAGGIGALFSGLFSSF